ncbi:MAG TPA: FecR domain-containing protein [Prolixibacteraceae bacterium]|nr:FecR domain-containing protein [Prolixibacteraceae bacterium]
MKEEKSGQLNNGDVDNEFNNSTIEKNEKLEHSTANVIEKIELLKQMEAIDTVKAHKNVTRIINQYRKPSIKLVLQKVAAVLIIPLLAFTLWQSYHLLSSKSSITQTEVSTPATLRSVFTLPDGTKVWLNGSTTLQYPSQFTGNERLVQLNGEAYFEVAPNKQKPFRVKAGNIVVEAVGTAFNCTAYASDNKFETVLTEGKVNIWECAEQGKKKLATLLPNQMATYNKNRASIITKNIDPIKYIAWIDGKIIFKNDNLSDVLLRLSRWYNVDFEINKKISSDYAFTGSFDGEELTQILKYIELTTPVKFEIEQTKTNKEQLYQKKKIIIKPVS